MKIASTLSRGEPLAAMAAMPSVTRVTRQIERDGIALKRVHSLGHVRARDMRKTGQEANCRIVVAASSSCSPSGETEYSTDGTAHRRICRLQMIRMMKTISLATLASMAFGIAGQQPGSELFASLALAIPAVSAEAMATAFRSAWAGLAAGCLHTLAGADHLAALTPLTIGQSHLRASMLGALWGFGHSTGQLLLGLLMVILKDRFQQLVPALSKWGGTTVGLTLLAIGALGVYESFFEGEHHHHDHGAPRDDNGSTKEKKGFGLATFATGIIYGLQPDALFVIIPALALPTKLAAIAYILMFVLGTVTAMGAYAGVIGATSQAIKKTNTRLTANLSGAASFMAIVIGFGVLLSGWGIHTPLAMA